MTNEEMIAGLVRAAEFKEQEEGGRIWDDVCSSSLSRARELGFGAGKVGKLAELPTDGGQPDIEAARAEWIEIGKALDSAAFAPPESRGWRRRAVDAMNALATALRYRVQLYRGVETVAGVPADTLTASEAVYGVLGWLTSRDLPITLSRSHGAAAAAEAAKDFCDANQLEDARPGWGANLRYPPRYGVQLPHRVETIKIDAEIGGLPPRESTEDFAKAARVLSDAGIKLDRRIEDDDDAHRARVQASLRSSLTNDLAPTRMVATPGIALDPTTAAIEHQVAENERRERVIVALEVALDEALAGWKGLAPKLDEGEYTYALSEAVFRRAHELSQLIRRRPAGAPYPGDAVGRAEKLAAELARIEKQYPEKL